MQIKKDPKRYVYNINRTKYNEKKAERNKTNEKQANNRQTKPNKKNGNYCNGSSAGHQMHDQKCELILRKGRYEQFFIFSQFDCPREMEKWLKCETYIRSFARC